MPAFEMGKDNKTAAFKAMSPLGKVPVLVTPDGPICEAAAVARYVARMRSDTNMYGSSFYEAGLVDQWIEFAKNELDLPVGMWIYPILGFIPSNASNTDKVRRRHRAPPAPPPPPLQLDRMAHTSPHVSPSPHL